MENYIIIKPAGHESRRIANPMAEPEKASQLSILPSEEDKRRRERRVETFAHHTASGRTICVTVPQADRSGEVYEERIRALRLAMLNTWILLFTAYDSAAPDPLPTQVFEARQLLQKALKEDGA
jgi:hypothetical protein